MTSLRSVAKKIDWKTIWPIVLMLIGSLCSFAVTFSLAKVLPTEKYGEIQYEIGLVSTISALMEFGLPNFLLKNVQFASDKKRFFSKCIVIITIAALAGFPIFWMVAYFWLSRVDSIKEILLVYGSAYTLVLSLMVSYQYLSLRKRTTSVLQYNLSPKLFLLISLLISLSLGAVSFFSDHYLFFFLLSYCVAAIPLLIINFKFVRVDFSKEDWFSILTFLSIAVLSSVETQLSKVFQGEFMADLTVTGALGLSSQILAIAKLVFASVLSIFRPTFAKLWREKDEKGISKLYFSITSFCSTIIIPFLIGTLIQSDILFSLFNQNYVQYSLIFIFLSAEALVSNLFGPLGTVMDMTGNEKTSLLGGSIQFGTFIILCVTLGRYFWWGIAFALALSSLIRLLPSVITMKKKMHIWPLTKRQCLLFTIEIFFSAGIFFGIRFVPVSAFIKVFIDAAAGSVLILSFQFLPSAKRSFKYLFGKREDETQNQNDNRP